MNSALLLMLIFIVFYFQIYPANSTKCRGIPTDKMEKTLKYTSTKPGQQNNKLVEIKYSASTLNEKEIYIGFTGENANLPKNKCVIINIYSNNDRNTQLYENSVKILNKLKEIDSKNERFIDLIDHGMIDKQNQIKESYKYLTILELGERDLNEEFEDIKFSTKDVKSKVVNIMKTLVELHKIGVHLDFKPTNVIAFERTLLPSILPSKYKLTGFDGSVLYSDGEKKGKIRRDLMGNIGDFTAPELLQNLSKFEQDDVEVNSKMDIWSAGITIFQILLLKRKMRPFDPILEKVTMIGELFRCAKFNSITENEMKELTAKHVKPKKSSKQVLLELMGLPLECADPGSKSWWKKYWGVIADILSIWIEMPEIVFLSVNMLSIDPEKRMSAQGAVDYLEGKCKPKEYEKNPKKIALFGDVSVEKLRELMEMEGFNLFIGFNKNEIKEETKVRGQSEKKKTGETKEKGETKIKGETKGKGEKKEKVETKENREKSEKEEKREKGEQRLKIITEKLPEAEKSLQSFLENLEKRTKFCDQ